MENFTIKLKNKFENEINIIKRVALAGLLVTSGCNSFHQNDKTINNTPIENVDQFNELPVTFEGIKINGDSTFISSTKEALSLLAKLPEFEIIKANIAIIEMSEHSGMDAALAIPTYGVNQLTYTSVTEWYASTIAHDSYHSYLYHKNLYLNKGKEPNLDTWTGKEAEKECIGFQLKVLKKITKRQNLISYLEELKKNPTYQDIPYEKRNW